MNPNSNQQPAFTPVGYLDQIAPKTNKRMDFLHSRPIIFGGIAIFIIIIAISVIGSLNNGSINPAEQLAARLSATEAIVSDANSKIQSNQLLSFNSNLDIYLINTIRDIKPLLARYKINVDKLSATAKSAESNTNLVAKLEDARLNAIYDRTYAREVSYRLDTTLSLMQQIYSSTNDSSLKSFLENAYQNLVPTQKQFADFNASDS